MPVSDPENVVSVLSFPVWIVVEEGPAIEKAPEPDKEPMFCIAPVDTQLPDKVTAELEGMASLIAVTSWAPIKVGPT